MSDSKIVQMKLVVLESPYAGDVAENLRYVRAAMRHCLLNGEAPFPSHALYTQEGVLDDTIPEERELGINAGFAIAQAIAKAGGGRVFMRDRGWSSGMDRGYAHGVALNQNIDIRRLPGWKSR